MPGFKNAHTHSAMTFLRSHADDLALDDWLYNRVFPAEGKLTGEDIYWHNQLAIMEYLTSGITAGFDMYLNKPATQRTVEDTGFRIVLCDGINDFGGTIEEVEESYLRYNQDSKRLLSYQLGFHAEYTTSRNLLEGMVALSKKYQSPVYTHCSETRKEVADCISRTGMPPVAYLDSLGMFTYGGGLFHGVHLHEEEFAIAKKNGLYIITNPASNLKLASGIAPIRRYLQEEIPVAIGTDGAASNNCLDMFREMFLVTGLQKAICEDPQAVPAWEVLKMATVWGAHAMGLPECDTIAKGKKADLILIDLQQPNMQPLQNVEKNLVYSGCKQNVCMTMVAGRVLYQDGQFYLGTSKEEIYAKANESARRILGV
jgi:5-methylthioadenosine/S-adenosylhomocysteine deaminase